MTTLRKKSIEVPDVGYDRANIDYVKQGKCLTRCQHVLITFILSWIALGTMIFSVTAAVLITYYVRIGYYGILVGIGTYIILGILFHILYGCLSRKYISGDNPEHLIVLVPGWLGFHLRMISLQRVIKNIHKQSNSNNNIIIKISQVNSNGYFTFPYIKTNDGIKKGGNRIYNEILSVINSHNSIKKISFIGCSLGGIYSRFVIKKLHENNILKNKNITPMNYISLGTPHIGTDTITKKQKMCCCSTRYNIIKKQKLILCCNKFDFSPNQLIRNDNQKLLKVMANNDPYINSLKEFNHIYCYGNIKFDSLVPFYSSCILKSESIEQELIKKYEKDVNDNNLGYLFININDKDMIINDDNCWYKKLNNDIDWTKIGVYFNQNFTARKVAHQYLSAPISYYKICEPLFRSLQDNFHF